MEQSAIETQWTQRVLKLSEPWSRWLLQCSLLDSRSDFAILQIPPELTKIANSLEFLSKVYGVAVSIFPKVTSVIAVSGPQYDLVQTAEIEIYDIR